MEKLRVHLLKSRLVTSNEAGSILWEWAFSFFASFQPSIVHPAKVMWRLGQWGLYRIKQPLSSLLVNLMGGKKCVHTFNKLFSSFSSVHLNRDVGDERVVAARGTEVHALVIYWICLERQVVYLMQGNRLIRQSNSMWLRPGTDHNPKADCGVWVFFHWAGLRCKSSKLKYMCISNEEHSLPHKQHRKRSNTGRLAASECTNTGLDSVSVLWLSANK